MIYDNYLTKALISLFGEECVKWDKIKIRNELERKIYKLHNKMINQKDHEIRNSMFDIYQNIRVIEDAFMEYYMKELNKIETKIY